MLQLSPVTPDALLYICENMRAADRAEVFDMEWDDDISRFSAKCVRIADYAWIARWNGKPIACVGANPIWPGVWNAFMFATDDFGQIGIGLTKFIRKAMIPGLISLNAHRVQAMSSAHHTWAHKWLKCLGAKHEATLKGFGRSGADFLVFAWDREGAERVTRSVQKQQGE